MHVDCTSNIHLNLNYFHHISWVLDTMKTKAKHGNWQLCSSQVLYFDFITWKGNEKAVKKMSKNWPKSYGMSHSLQTEQFL